MPTTIGVPSPERAAAPKTSFFKRLGPIGLRFLMILRSLPGLDGASPRTVQLIP